MEREPKTSVSQRRLPNLSFFVFRSPWGAEANLQRDSAADSVVLSRYCRWWMLSKMLRRRMIKAVFFGEFVEQMTQCFALVPHAPYLNVLFDSLSRDLSEPDDTDLDDTLVPTTCSDRDACVLVEGLLTRQVESKDLNPRLVLDAFRDSLRDSPWDPKGEVDSDTWRRQLWLHSLRKCDAATTTSNNKDDKSPVDKVGKLEDGGSVNDDDGTKESSKINDENAHGEEPLLLRRLAHDCWSVWSSARLQRCRMSKETVDALCSLRDDGAKNSLRLGVITNGRTDVQLQKIEACGIASYVDVIFIGDDVETPRAMSRGGAIDDKTISNRDNGDRHQPEKYGDHSTSKTPGVFIHRAKPCPSIFEAACAAVGCTPAEAAMVGDSFEMDVCGAATADFAAAFLVTGGHQAAEKEMRTNDHDKGSDGTFSARERKINAINERTLVLQCSTVAEVPRLLRERQMIP